MTQTELDPIFKALADTTRREILDALRDRPQTTTELVEKFSHLSRFGVMKHIDILREAGLVRTRKEGRKRINSINVIPIREVYERWVSRFQDLWAQKLVGLKQQLEEDK